MNDRQATKSKEAACCSQEASHMAWTLHSGPAKSLCTSHVRRRFQRASQGHFEQGRRHESVHVQHRKKKEKGEVRGIQHEAPYFGEAFRSLPGPSIGPLEKSPSLFMASICLALFTPPASSSVDGQSPTSEIPFHTSGLMEDSKFREPFVFHHRIVPPGLPDSCVLRG
jgi:hypothetical protein